MMRRMPFRLFNYWAYFDSIEPEGSRVDDLRMAMICASVRNSNAFDKRAGHYTASMFLPKWRDPDAGKAETDSTRRQLTAPPARSGASMSGTATGGDFGKAQFAAMVAVANTQMGFSVDGHTRLRGPGSKGKGKDEDNGQGVNG